MEEPKNPSKIDIELTDAQAQGVYSNLLSSITPRANLSWTTSR